MKLGYVSVFCGMLASCTHPYRPESRGVTGYVSDRAWEIDADINGRVAQPAARSALASTTHHGWLVSQSEVDFQRVSGSLESEGRSLFLDRAMVELTQVPSAANEDNSGLVDWHARVQSFATLSEVPTGPSAYRNDAVATFHSPPSDAARAKPNFAALVSDHLLSVGVLFGQMTAGDLVAGDAGYWSRDTLALDIEAKGFQKDSHQQGGWERYSAVRGSLRVDIDLGGPELLRLDADAAENRATLRALLASHEISYINGHANQESLDALGSATCYRPAAYRVVMLDICWSYFLYAKPILEAAPFGQTQVINAAGRVITGSAESFSLLLDLLVFGSEETLKENTQEQPTWVGMMRALNDQADARAHARLGKVTAQLEPAEIYGVSGVWNPAEPAAD